jgi:L-alanine-DL-glutamate epimerase-like enolase superfamily enzyme
MVIASTRAGTAQGLGWTQAAAAAGDVIADVLADTVIGRSAPDVAGAAEAMARAVRNIGRPGIAATAISAMDIALWDLKARRCPHLRERRLHRLTCRGWTGDLPKRPGRPRRQEFA